MQLSNIALALTSVLGSKRKPALDLDFSANETLDPRITFSRTSNATRTNAQGLIEYAPHNLLTYSEQFDNAVWVKSNATVTANTVTAPDGTVTAERITDTIDAVNTVHSISQSITWLSGTSYTLSVYGKAGTLAGLHLLLPSNSFGIDTRANFDLTNGTSQVTAGTATTSITLVSDGYYRCSISATTTTAATASFQIRTMKMVGGSLSSFYQGDGTGTLFYWGAQLNIGSLQPYYTTSVKNLLGYSQNFENAAWTKSNSNVLTNLLTYSQEFDNAAWVKAAVSVSANQRVSPDGTISMDTITLTGGAGYLQQAVGTTNAVVYTLSIFIYAASNKTRLIAHNGTIDICNITWSSISSNTNTITGTATNVTSTLVGNSIYKLSFSFTASSATTNIRIQCLDASGNSVTGATGDFWGAQLVQGTNPEEYTATTSAPAPIQVMGPFGYLGAMKLVESAVAGEHNLSEAITYTAGTTYTLSVYAKAGERNFVVLSYGSGAFGAATRAYFNLATGVVGTTANSPTTSIVSIGGGWYRCSITKTATVSAAANTIINETSTDGVLSYTGDGSSGIYIYGAQLSDSASLDTYSYNFGAAPTSSAYYGPRFDYDPVTLAPKGLLIEESRTNLLTYSDQFDNAVWTKGTGVAISSNSITSPDGTATADTITANGGISVTSIYYDSISVTASTSYTFSFYVKLGTLAASDYRIAVYNVSGSSFIAVDITPSQTPNSSSWTRVSYTFTTPVGCTVVRVYPYRSGATVTNATYYLWGAQLEAGAFPTSYIPTTSAQVPRTADNASMVGTNFSSWYNQSEGTVVAEYDIILNTVNRVIFDIGAGGVFGTTAYGVQTNSYIGLLPGFAPVNMESIVYTASLTNKIATGLQNNNSIISVNTVLGALDTSCTMPASATTLTIGCSQFNGSFATFLNGHIKSIKYYPTRLPNGDLIALSS